MKVNAPPLVGTGFKMLVVQQDPRVTSLGRWLRCGIDELPQLWSIVRSEMKWVGPRPDEVWMLPHYGPVCKQRLSVFPGVTGLAQVLDSRNIPTADGFAIDLWYIAHRSFWLDAWVMLVTPLFMAGWRTLGRGRLKRLRCSPEFERFRQCCDSELSAAEIASPDSVDSASVVAKMKLS
jgi:lipopolysaccharide/colanic/teichoic acid biosynthesis glycosyltransferase